MVVVKVLENEMIRAIIAERIAQAAVLRRPAAPAPITPGRVRVWGPTGEQAVQYRPERLDVESADPRATRLEGCGRRRRPDGGIGPGFGSAPARAAPSDMTRPAIRSMFRMTDSRCILRLSGTSPTKHLMSPLVHLESWPRGNVSDLPDGTASALGFGGQRPAHHSPAPGPERRGSVNRMNSPAHGDSKVNRVVPSRFRTLPKRVDSRHPPHLARRPGRARVACSVQARLQ